MDKVNIVFATDENYARNVSAAMVSLVRTHPDVPLSISILDSGMTEESRARLLGMSGENLSVQLCDLQRVHAFTEQVRRTGFTAAIFSRIFIPEILIGEQRALYLDADVLVMSSLTDLYHTDMRGKAIAMVQDMVIADACCRRLGIPRYFNSGVILFDLERCRQLQCTRRWQEYLCSLTQQLPFPDQDVINIVSQREIVELAPRYNFLFVFHPFVRDAADIRSAGEQAAILHFCDHHKPWLPAAKAHPFEELYLQMMQGTPWAGEVPELRRRKRLHRMRCCLICWVYHGDEKRGKVKTLRVLGVPLFTRRKTAARRTFYLFGVPFFSMTRRVVLGATESRL